MASPLSEISLSACRGFGRPPRSVSTASRMYRYRSRFPASVQTAKRESNPPSIDPASASDQRPSTTRFCLRIRPSNSSRSLRPLGTHRKRESLLPRETDRACDDADAVSALEDRKSTRLNSSHVKISYAVFCLKKKKLDIP